jgi:hypothetical protein
MGRALGSIIAVIMTPQPRTKAVPSAHVAGIGIVIMSSPCRLDRTTETHAATATARRTAEVRSVALSGTGLIRIPLCGRRPLIRG